MWAAGTGVLTAQLQSRADEAVGVDFSANMIGEASRKHPALSFKVANAENLPFDDASFDVAVVNYSAHHLARPEKAFSEIRRVLKSSGRLAVIHPIQSRQPSWGSFADAVADVCHRKPFPAVLFCMLTNQRPTQNCWRIAAIETSDVARWKSQCPWIGSKHCWNPDGSSLVSALSLRNFRIASKLVSGNELDAIKTPTAATHFQMLCWPHRRLPRCHRDQDVRSMRSCL